MSSQLVSRLTMSTLLAIGLALVPLSISPSGLVEEATVCASGGKCIFEPGSFCDGGERWDYFDAPTQVGD